ncbi:AbiH family protein [Terrisporobacter petrolearius]|uniref:AbiH family protein n=1 Tax=Terrisporobacter petrolearius TaxID=1460447 RepID=UPI003AFFFE51
MKGMSPTNEKNILVIGNGFDLYHGFPTKYSDFINFIKLWDDFYSKYTKNISNKEHMANPKYIDLTSYNINKETMLKLADYYNIYNKTKLDTFDKLIKDNDWINYFKDVCSETKGWIDFEGEIETIIKCIQYLFIKCIDPNSDINRPEKFNNIFTTPQEYFNKTLTYYNPGLYGFILRPVGSELSNIDYNKKIILKTLKKQLDDLIDCLNIYLLEFVSKMKPNKQAEDIKNINPFCIISFNYTNTFKEIYKGYHIIHYIHGKIGDENNMVLGMKDDNMNDDIDFVYFYKYFQRIQKKTGVDYNKWLSEGSNNIYILGHSLDSTDKDVLTKIITSKNTKQVTLFYRHQKEMEKFIINLLKLFSRDDVIKFTSEEKIIFTKLEKDEL